MGSSAKWGIVMDRYANVRRITEIALALDR
jgi:hypothetical protein